MSYIDAFKGYGRHQMSTNDAITKITEDYTKLLLAGNLREATKAQLCLTFFSRYSQYNKGTISRQDLLLFLRDFILFVGRFPMPTILENAIRESGNDYGLDIAEDGYVDAASILPEWLPNKVFVQQVYKLSQEGLDEFVPVIGDSIISQHSRFSKYRSIEQKIVVHAAVQLPADYTLMVSLPTGGGKSLITQMLATTSSGLTIVVVPTVALASDQYIQAKNCLVKGDIQNHIFCYHSDTTPTETARMLREIEDQKARLVFTSPEALLKNIALNNTLLAAAKQKYLCNVVIDEAHIVPDWGTHFRPDFQIFSVVLRKLRYLSEHTIRTYLLSATLSEDVVQVLFELFGQEGKNVQYRCDTLRKEPRFIFSECRDYWQRENRAIELVKVLPNLCFVCDRASRSGTL